uniref:PH domain-containing protein n=1 Tax=Heterorhabditis bacteriophora TaxID=37862 RepID=A0A1I7XIE0_HETBA
MKDIEELGVLVWFPTIALVIIIVLILRVHHYRLLRIYQNRNNVDKYIAIGSRNIVGQKEILFDRSNASAFYYAEDQTDIVRLGLNFLFGNMQVGKRRYLVMDDAFKGNNYRSYMLNETSVVPRL